MQDEFPDARTLIHRYGLGPKKSLGQNFLVDESYLDVILATADLSQDDTVLEIGPGLGVLTHRLAALADRVVAVELDDRLISLLEDQFADQPNIGIVHGDILELDPGKLTNDTYKVVANLPYYITSPVLRHLLEAQRPPELAVVMVQKEVAERICAAPGQMSILAVSVQFYAEPSLIATVSAGAFYPQPKVDSAVLRLATRPQPAVPDIEPDHYFRVVKAGFSQKRKQLLNSLSGGLQMPKEQVRDVCSTADVDPKRRAQMLSLAEWGRLSRAFLN